MAASSSSDETSKHLQAYVWDLTAAYDSQGRVAPHAQSTVQSPPRLQFDAQRVSLLNLCNTIGAAYSLQDGRLQISIPMSTKRACVDRELMALEQRMTTQLPQVQRHDFSVGATPSLVLHFSDGSRWELKGTPVSQGQMR